MQATIGIGGYVRVERPIALKRPSRSERRASKARRDQPARRPGAADFTAGAVGRAVLSETLQHPLTILPAATAAVGGLYMGLIGPDPASFALTFGGAVLGVGAWIFNYFVRGERFAAAHVETLRAARQQHRLDELATLETDWKAVGHAEGLQQARELREAYTRLEDYLQGRIAEGGGLDVQRLMVLAEDTYDEGVTVLRLALEAHQALQVIDVAKLRHELTTWRRELSAARELGLDDPRLAGHETRIAGHERRLALCADREATLAAYLGQSEALESALETAYLEVIDLHKRDVLMARGNAASALERAVDAARRVEDRMRDALAPEREGDDRYLEAADP